MHLGQGTYNVSGKVVQVDRGNCGLSVCSRKMKMMKGRRREKKRREEGERRRRGREGGGEEELAEGGKMKSSSWDSRADVLS